MFKPGDRIFIPGASGAPSALVAPVFGATGVEIVTSFVPGVNRLHPGMIGSGTRVTGLFMQPDLAPAQQSGAYRHTPMSYAAMVKHLRATPAFDICVVQVSPPDANGHCSLGPAAEFIPEVMGRARRIVAVVNARVPRIPNACVVPASQLEVVVESDDPLVAYDVGVVDEQTRAIARTVASYIDDGAVLQAGLGKVPHALFDALHDRRGIRLHSGMLSDGVMGLVESGALDPRWQHITTVVLGSAALYEWTRDRAEIHVCGCERSHDPVALAAIQGFIAVNSALEVDLFGQCNLELAGGRAVSGAGGAPDFARAARNSPGGLSIVALPATFGAGKGSRIRPWLGESSLVTLPRTEVDLIVTEEGAADLRGRSVHERAEAIIAIAAPAARAELADRWREIAGRL